MFIRLFVTLFSIWFSATAAASDLAREKRLSDQIVDAILDGDPVTLSAAGREFLGIYTEADDVKGAVLIMHGRGQHPDWAEPIAPLRVALTEHGWATLSIQMPVLSKDAKYYDYVPIFPEATPRIEAGIAYLRGQGYENVVLLPHSCSAHMFQDWIGSAQRSAVEAAVLLSMGATDYKQPMKVPMLLDQLSVPVLDIYGELDYPSVVNKSEQRLAQLKSAGSPLSKQLVIAEADHYYRGQTAVLVDAIVEWLNGLSGSVSD